MVDKKKYTPPTRTPTGPSPRGPIGKQPGAPKQKK